MLRKGYTTFLAYMKEAKKESPRLEDIHVVRKYPDVFLDKLPRLSLEKEVEFMIKLIPGTKLISISPY